MGAPGVSRHKTTRSGASPAPGKAPGKPPGWTRALQSEAIRLVRRPAIREVRVCDRAPPDCDGVHVCVGGCRCDHETTPRLRRSMSEILQPDRFLMTGSTGVRVA